MKNRLNNTQHIKPGSIKAWFLAARPKTLTGAIAPVLIGGALAWRVIYNPAFIESARLYINKPNFDIYLQQKMLHFLVPFICCLLFATLMQISANFINDYYDYIKGTDRNDRLGPLRACQQGWVTPKAMLIATILILTLAASIGMILLIWNMQWELLSIGVACIIFCILYTTHLSYMGLGDILVILFFGLIPVCFTYYIITNGQYSTPLVLLAISQGLITDTLLIVNNYRDRHQDCISGKNTFIVRIIKKLGEIKGSTITLLSYLGLGIIATVLTVTALVILGCKASIIIILIPLLLHCHTSFRMTHTDGQELNNILSSTARNILFFGLFTAIILLLP